MKRNTFVISAILILLASACGPRATPTANPADIASTAQAAAYTIAAQTLQALPTNTPVPPPATLTPIPPPTDTPPPLPTQATQDGLGTAVVFPTGLPTFTPPPSSGSANNQDPCNQPLTSWQGPTANFTISNQTKPQGTIILSMFVVTEMNQCGYLIITGNSFSGPIGQYSAGAFITGKKNMKAFGSFRITEGNWKIVVKNDGISAAGGCYPNC